MDSMEAENVSDAMQEQNTAGGNRKNIRNRFNFPDKSSFELACKLLHEPPKQKSQNTEHKCQKQRLQEKFTVAVEDGVEFIKTIQNGPAGVPCRVLRQEEFDAAFQKHHTDHQGAIITKQAMEREFFFVPQELVRTAVRNCGGCAARRQHQKPPSGMPIPSTGEICKFSI